MGVAVFAAIWLVDRGGVGGLVQAVVVVGAMFAAVTVRVAGGTVIDWVTVVASAWWWRLLRRDRFVDPVRFVDEARRVPAAMAGVAFVPVGGHGWGGVADRSTRSLSMVFGVEGMGFQLLTSEDQARMVSRWGEVLAGQSFEGSPVVRVSWTAQSGPTGMGAHRAWVSSVRPGGDSEGNGDAAGSYDELVDTIGAAAGSYDVWVTVTLDTRRVGWRR